MNSLYPLFLKLVDKPVLVVGGGPVALRRTERLLESRARVVLVSPQVVPALKTLSDLGRIEWRERCFELGDLEGKSIVLLAAGSAELLEELRRETRLRGILLSAAEDEELSDFHVPSVLTRGDVKVAVSTGGKSPRGAARICDEISAWLTENGPFLDAALAMGRSARALSPQAVEREETSGKTSRQGKVYLVGAGPGDSGLLTVRAAQLLQKADVVYYDRLVSDAVLEVIRPDAEKIYVGKDVGCAKRADTSALMVSSARQGKTVVRLKGGDPLIFGRGGEEMLSLREAGIEFELVPGVSALSSVPASAGIPVTFRGISSEIIVRSGHSLGPDPHERRPDESESQTGRSGRSEGATYVYFMAAGRLTRIVEDLRAEGLPPSTPVAVIQRGTLPDQKILLGSLADIVELAEARPIETPALLVAGEVVKLADFKELLPVPAGEKKDQASSNSVIQL